MAEWRNEKSKKGKEERQGRNDFIPRNSGRSNLGVTILPHKQ